MYAMQEARWLMIKTLLGIIASPRKYGNCELFTKEVFRNLQGGWKLRLMRLPELDIRPCRACYQCLFGEMKCPQEDDFQVALEALVQADAWVVAAPTYFLGANSSLKRFLDRGLSFYAHLDHLWGKPAVGIAIAGINGMEGYTKLGVDSFIRLALGDHRGSAVVYGALPGEIFLENVGKRAAADLAKVLLGGKAAAANECPTCPRCGGDTFRFLSENNVRCMLCSSSGSFSMAAGRVHFDMTAGAHDLFLSYESARKHAEWLRGMKEKFLERRKELKNITRDYTQEGEWVGKP
jgi:multimeric flavodoxin WrbA